MKRIDRHKVCSENENLLLIDVEPKSAAEKGIGQSGSFKPDGSDTGPKRFPVKNPAAMFQHNFDVIERLSAISLRPPETGVAEMNEELACRS